MFLEKNKKWISICLISLLLFARFDLGIVYNKIFMLINVAINGITILYCGYLGLKDKNTIKKSLINPAVLWVLLFSILVFIYGHYKIGTYTDMYSRQYALLTVVPAVLIMIILYYNMDDMLEILSVAGSFTIVTTLITSLKYDYVWGEWVDGTISESRVGATPAGTCVDTANFIIILLIPIIYNIYVNKTWKKFALPAALGIFLIFASGAKAAIIPLAFVFIILIIGTSKDKKVLRRNMVVLGIAAVIGVILIMSVPLLYRIIGARFVELFTSLNDKEYDLHTSTGQRMAVTAEFRKHFGEHPIFGHGFYAFKEMPYSQLEEYKVDGVVNYRHIHIHNNFMEILFGFGIVGFILYYWLPVYVLIKSFMSKNKQVIILVLSIMVSFLFIDLGLDMFYNYMTPYFAYLVAYCILKKGENESFS
ncbi:O-antigen ligase family protein [Pseudobutyrivibrio sp.]|uniref:O-antigen ligase family protein n=1 Tax=Pseudobutyrivibrio sp. TaxID=2014367 RepID=UPI0025EF0E1D|nr:O-antigen ligase family protein [Pseudobutyrivibrio sp.]MBR5648351.1 O-antigen ligase family protein [Pseudobutyrivibrio sp.]